MYAILKKSNWATLEVKSPMHVLQMQTCVKEGRKQVGVERTSDVGTGTAKHANVRGLSTGDAIVTATTLGPNNLVKMDVVTTLAHQ